MHLPKFPGLNVEKLKGGIFDGPDVQKRIQDESFIYHMTPP